MAEMQDVHQYIYGVEQIVGCLLTMLSDFTVHDEEVVWSSFQDSKNRGPLSNVLATCRVLSADLGTLEIKLDDGSEAWLLDGWKERVVVCGCGDATVAPVSSTWNIVQVSGSVAFYPDRAAAPFQRLDNNWLETVTSEMQLSLGHPYTLATPLQYQEANRILEEAYPPTLTSLEKPIQRSLWMRFRMRGIVTRCSERVASGVHREIARRLQIREEIAMPPTPDVYEIWDRARVLKFSKTPDTQPDIAEIVAVEEKKLARLALQTCGTVKIALSHHVLVWPLIASFIGEPPAWNEPV